MGRGISRVRQAHLVRHWGGGPSAPPGPQHLGGDAFPARQRRRLLWGLAVVGVALAVGLFTVATAALDGHPHPSDELGADGEEVVVTWQGQDCEFVDRDSTVVRAVGPQVQVALWAVRDPAMGCGAAEERTTRLPLPGGLGDRQLVDVACTGSETRHAHC